MYRIFDISLTSNISLPELQKTEQRKKHLSFHLSSNPPGKISFDWFHHFRDSCDNITISCAKQGYDYYLRFPEIADFRIALLTNSITCYPCPRTKNSSIRHLLLDQVIPRFMAHKGRLVIHASATELNKRCVVFLGDTGCGKSTLAAYFHQQGYQLLTDDSLILHIASDRIEGLPGYTGSRLWLDSSGAIFKTHNLMPMAHYSSKKRLIIHEQNTTPPLPVRAFFMLTPPDKPAQNQNIEITPIKGAQFFLNIVKNSFLLDATDRNVIKKQFQLLANFHGKDAPFYRLSHPHNYKLLQDVFKEICKFLNTEK